MYILCVIICYIIIFDKTEATEQQGYCAPYNGAICKKYVNTTKLVWFNSSGGYENEKITKGLWQEMIEGLKGLCRTSAEVHSFTNVNVDQPHT